MWHKISAQKSVHLIFGPALRSPVHVCKFLRWTSVRTASRYGNLTNRQGNSSWFLQKTNDDHDATMQHPFMKTIYAKNYDREAYGAYLWSQYRLFAALEDAVQGLKHDPSLTPVYDEQLNRKTALEMDLRYWLGGTELPLEDKYATMRGIVKMYEHELSQEAGDAKALLCHHFLHYNAVLSGGQFLSSMISSAESIEVEKDPTGVAFYIFLGLANPAARVQRYLKSMDTIELSEEDRSRMLLIMRRIYKDVERIFDAAYEIAPRSGQEYGEAKEEVKEAKPEKYLKLSLQDLRGFDGSNGKRILLSLQAKIFDVSSGAGAYGPGGPYHVFAGRDVTKSLALMDLSEGSLDQPDFVPDTEDAKNSLTSWNKRLSSKYKVVGELVQPLHLTLQELRSFDGKDGGRILLSLSGTIIDVTEAAATYGPCELGAIIWSYHLELGSDLAM